MTKCSPPHASALSTLNLRVCVPPLSSSDFHGVVYFTDRGRGGPVNGTGNRAGNDRATEPWVGHFPGSVCQGDLRNERVARRERCSR